MYIYVCVRRPGPCARGVLVACGAFSGEQSDRRCRRCVESLGLRVNPKPKPNPLNPNLTLIPVPLALTPLTLT